MKNKEYMSLKKMIEYNTVKDEFGKNIKRGLK